MQTKLVFFLTALLCLPLMVIAQNGTLSGTVVNANTGEPLINAQIVIIDNEQYGASTDLLGEYAITRVPVGTYEVKASHIGAEGYAEKIKSVTLYDEGTTYLNFELESEAIVGEVVDVSFDYERVKQEEKTMAVTTTTKEEIEATVGGRDISESIERTNSVFIHEDGGGAGETRINIRGFDERNVAVMINGVPVNGMENGKIYWSNWDGLSDITQDIQTQRGMGASSLAISSVGGTMNIITDAATMEPEIIVKRQYGADRYRKWQISASTGLIDQPWMGWLRNKIAISGALVRKTGNGFIDKGWTDAYAYFGTMSFKLNKKHTFQFMYTGAPQQHASRYGNMPVAAWDTDFALDLGVDTTYFDGEERGLRYNPDWGTIITFGTEQKEWYNGELHDIPDPTYINENVNYYHKPVGNFNWFYQVNDRLRITNIAYYSYGEGGGTRQNAVNDRYIEDNVYGQLDFQSAINFNKRNIDSDFSDSLHRSETILSNVVNEHFWYGWIGKAKYKLIDSFDYDLDISGGLDYRYYAGKHYKEVRNLLGGDYYVPFTGEQEDLDKNADSPMKTYGDKISYHNDGLVRWLGGFGTVEYRSSSLYGFANFALSNTSYKRIDYFLQKVDGDWNSIGWDTFTGFGTKGGVNYDLPFLKDFQVYGTVGYMSQAPAFNGVYNYYQEKYDDITNEAVTSFEVGVSLLKSRKMFDYDLRFLEIDLNYYNTLWENKTWTRYVQDDSTDVYYNYQYNGIDALHQGVELNIVERPHKKVKIEYTVSLGDWRWKNDVLSYYSPEENPGLIDSVFAYIDGLKVGDAPQTSMILNLSYYPIKRSYITATVKDYRDHYAYFSPTDRDTPRERDVQPWKIPPHTLFDLHFGYTFAQIGGSDVELKIQGNVYNLFDTKYITSAWDGQYHDAETSDVYFGRLRTWNLSFTVTY